MIDYKKTAINMLGLLVICAIVLAAIYLGIQFWPFLIAIVFAILLERSINFIVKKTKAPRKAVGTIMVVLVYILIGIIVYLLASALIKEAIDLSTKLPGVFEDLKLEYNDLYNEGLELLKGMPKTVTDGVYDIGLSFIGKLTDIINSIISMI